MHQRFTTDNSVGDQLLLLEDFMDLLPPVTSVAVTSIQSQIDRNVNTDESDRRQELVSTFTLFVRKNTRDFIRRQSR